MSSSCYSFFAHDEVELRWEKLYLEMMERLLKAGKMTEGIVDIKNFVRDLAKKVMKAQGEGAG